MPLRRHPLHGLLLAVSLALALVAPGARAQIPPAAALPASAPVQASPDELDRLVATIEDDKQRAAFIGELKALIATERAEAPKPVAAGPAGWLDSLSEEVDAISGEILTAAAVVVDAPRLVGWLDQQIQSPEARTRWLEIGLKLATIFTGAILAEVVIRFLVTRPTARYLGRRDGSDVLHLLRLAAAAAAELVPVVAFAVVAYAILPLTHPHLATQQVAGVLIRATAWIWAVLGLVRVALLSPSATALYPLADETRNYLYIWSRRFVVWAVYGYGVAAAAWWLGVPGAIYALVLRVTILVLAILAIIFVLQNRTAVATWLRGGRKSGDPASGSLRLLRHLLADTWHLLAIFYLAGVFSIYVVHIQADFLSALRASLITVVVILVAILAVRVARRLSRHGFSVSPDLKERFPTLETRANRYLPVLTLVTAIVIYLFAALAVLEAWGVNSFSWVESDTGRRITGSTLTIGLLLVLALIAWEVFSNTIERYLDGIDSHDLGRQRSARLRTLLPLFRTTMMVVLVTIVGLIVLSELGLNIAPLLAGAGIVGIAVGFGSQALVKDVITGLFILMEDALAVGDIVDVGKGSGVIERISVRSLRLRDAAGNLQTIPFGEVSTVRNMSRDYGYVVCDAGVLYDQDPDRVMAEIKKVGEAICADPDWAPSILAPLEVWGVDRFTDTAIVIRSRLKAAPTRQWDVGREFNRRLKKAFDAAGIEMPSMNQTHYLAPPPSV